MSEVRLPETIMLAINRLAEIQGEERVLKKEKDSLRKATFDALISSKLEKALTAKGHTASIHPRVTERADKKFILSLLTEDQQLQAYTTKLGRVLKIT